MKNKYCSLVKILSVVFVLSAVVIMPRVSHAADPSITATQTVANQAAGVNNQGATTTTSVANVPETKASRTIGVSALPGNAETITIGSCVVTFTTVASSTTDELNCGDNAASIDRTLSTGDTLRTTAQIATSLQSLTNASSSGTHGALTITSGGTATTTTFTTTNTETSATPITFTDGTSGDIVNISSTTGVIPVAQVNIISIGGTVETGDIYTATLPTVGDVSYTVTSGDTSTSTIAAGLKTAILASSGYSSQAFTAATSTGTVVLTAKVAGTGFTQTSTTTNLPAIAQVVEFTPGDTNGIIHSTYTATINSTDYPYVAALNTVQNVVEGLNTALADETAVDCTENDIKVTCTASTAGTSFTYDASVTAGTGSSGGHSGGGGGGGSSSSNPPVIAPPSTNPEGCIPGYSFSPFSGAKCNPSLTVANNPPTVSNAFTRDLTTGAVGDDVRQLQVYLNAHGFPVALTGVGSAGQETTYFGALTQAALAKYQAANGISPAAGYFGPITRGSLK